ncbi:glycosyltransferase family 4 protein [Thermoleptolyngbya sichuanensis A183]|uniref:Glycosyltransferase family 4 protein n=1 Tax=Thermoleptolyngbya sichuanensis A183 TaxID=2737172 RepID=A0A6M8BKR5_9CYAN|nr:glycosyltransferase [Thermoleptolyngbya sichuanensis]QKD84221.1 glycosyltransferase family 4 protein [Thermoleptolyngbya sichuanensis A183]
MRNSDSKTYLMVLPVYYYRLDSQTVALESAFVKHLMLLREKISPIFNHLVVGLVEMSDEEYSHRKQWLSVVDESEAGIRFKSLYRVQDLSSKAQQFFQLFRVANRLKSLISQCDLLHTGLAANIWFPMEFIATLLGRILKKPTVYVVDIDFRNTAQMSYETGTWSLKSYLLCKYIYDSFRALQVYCASKICSLILLKGEKLCRDFGRGKPNVKNFLDAAHSRHHIIRRDRLAQKLLNLEDQGRPLEVVYFGRLTPYKGVDRCLHAVAIAHHQFGCDVVFHVIGSGEQLEELKRLAQSLKIIERVIFHGALPFNQDFFEKLYSYHLLLAAPLNEDTPRSALDAMAAGIPILAFDTYYYRDLSATGAVDTVAWPSIEEMSQKIAYYSKNRDLLADMAVQAVEFAKQNTQEEWLQRRFEWTLAFAGITQPALATPQTGQRQLSNVS